MALSAQDYAAMLRGLMPSGPAWNDALVSRMLDVWSIEFARLELRVATVVAEADPRSAVELLPDWERVLGLPDECMANVDLSFIERRRLAWAKLTEEGGQSRAYFLSLAARYGEPDAEITDGFLSMTCNDDCNDALYGVDDRFVWIVRFNHPAANRRAMTCNDDCTTALQLYTPSLAECPLRERKPAHTTVLFAYFDEDLLDFPDWQDWARFLDLTIADVPAA